MLAFWLIGGLGAVLLVLSLVLGEVLDGALDALDPTGFLSTAALGGFGAAFGLIGGCVLAATETGAVPAALAGTAGGLALGALAVALTRSMSRMGTDRALSATDLVGMSGVVVSAIPAGSYGRVSMPVGGHPLQLNARADRAIPAGAEVFVVQTLSETAVQVRGL